MSEKSEHEKKFLTRSAFWKSLGTIALVVWIMQDFLDPGHESLPWYLSLARVLGYTSGCFTIAYVVWLPFRLVRYFRGLQYTSNELRWFYLSGTVVLILFALLGKLLLAIGELL